MVSLHVSLSLGVLRMSTINRRVFQQSVASAGALAALRGGGWGVRASNARVPVGVIGAGSRGDQFLDALLCHKDAEIVGLWDVYEPYLAAAQNKVGSQARLHHDFRELVDRKDID